MNPRTYSITTQGPAACSSTDLGQFEQLVLRGGEVILAGLGGRIGRSFQLAWALDKSAMVAVAALKSPNENYHQSVFRKSESSEQYSDWEAELGWIYTKEEHRHKGLARGLVAALFEKESDRRTFATTRELNDPILPLLEDFGFVQEGKAYASTNGDYRLLLHVRRA